jgi:NAD(P)-dependent dehydrogenase (short-subunit alcohol dehydrogenase family)
MGDRLKGKTAIVTGAGSVPGPPDQEAIGNGKAAAIIYAREGASVLVVDTVKEAAEDTQRLIHAEGGNCAIFTADVSKAHDCVAIAKECAGLFGRIDILHNNVGIMPPKLGGILEADENDWDLVMNVNLKSIFHTCRAVIPYMLRQQKGCILNTSSTAAVDHRNPGVFIYTVSKIAVHSLTRSLAVEFADKAIRVNCIMPGLIDSPTIYSTLSGHYGGDLKKMRRERGERVPMKRMGSPWEIAKTALFLVSNDAKYITGQIVGVDGGLTALAG